MHNDVTVLSADQRGADEEGDRQEGGEHQLRGRGATSPTVIYTFNLFAADPAGLAHRQGPLKDSTSHARPVAGA
jgi:hypothetical protein